MEKACVKDLCVARMLEKEGRRPFYADGAAVTVLGFIPTLSAIVR